MHWKWNKMGKANLRQKDSLQNKLWPQINIEKKKHPFYPVILKLVIKAWFFTLYRELPIYKFTERKKSRKIKYKHFLIKNDRENQKNDHSLSFHITGITNVFCRLNQMGPITVNMRFQSLCIILSILSCFATQIIVTYRSTYK